MCDRKRLTHREIQTPQSLLWLCVLLCVLPAPAQATEFVWAIHGGLRFTQQNNFFDPTSTPLQFNQDRTGATFLFGVLGLLQLNEQIELSGTLDIGELFLGNTQKGTENRTFSVLLNNWRLNTNTTQNSQLQAIQKQCEDQVLDLQKQGRTNLSLEQCKISPWYLQESFFIRELYVSIYLTKYKALKLNIGMMRYTLGSGFLYDNYGLGIGFEANLQKFPKPLPVTLRFDAFLPDQSFTAEGKKSPVFHLKVDFRPQKQHKIGLFFTYLYDGNNLAGRLLLPFWQELFADAWNERIYKITSQNPKLSCYKEPQYDALKALLPKETRTLQESCEKANATRAQKGEPTQLCPLDEVVLVPFEQSCTIPDSSGHHMWLGLEGSARWGALRIEGQAILYMSWMRVGIPKTPRVTLPSSHDEWSRFGSSSQQGTLTGGLQTQQNDPLSTQIQDKEIKGLGFSGELKLSYQWTPAFTTSLFFLFTNGNSFSSINQEYIYTFMGISPQLRHLHIFFNGGINDYSSKRGISISGIFGKGYLVAGLLMQYELKEKMSFQFTSAPIWSHTLPGQIGEGQQAGNFYGFELNLRSSYQLWSWLRPVLQIDFFFPGTFFVESRPPPLLFQLQLGLNFIF